LDYRVHRAKTSRTSRPPSRSAIHQDIVTLRQVLKTAIRHGWIQGLPDLSAPYRKSGKVEHRAWFFPAELVRLIARRASVSTKALPAGRIAGNGNTSSSMTT
jgi:hypothetical protein